MTAPHNRKQEPASRGSSEGPAQPPVQLVLNLPYLISSGLEDFLISRSNAPAVALVEGWPGWPHSAVAICGPAGSGKTHLAQAWQVRSGAASVQANQLSETMLHDLEESQGLVVEDIDHGIADERILFHIFNVAHERNLSVLVTSALSPGDLNIALPDLRSRLRALPLAIIQPPDDALLQAVLVKLFADRQLTVDPPVISYMATHMERSMAAARCVVAAADELALSHKRKVSRVLAAEALALVAARGDGPSGDDGA